MLLNTGLLLAEENDVTARHTHLRQITAVHTGFYRLWLWSIGSYWLICSQSCRLPSSVVTCWQKTSNRGHRVHWSGARTPLCDRHIVSTEANSLCCFQLCVSYVHTENCGSWKSVNQLLLPGLAVFKLSTEQVNHKEYSMLPCCCTLTNLWAKRPHQHVCILLMVSSYDYVTLYNQLRQSTVKTISVN